MNEDLLSEARAAVQGAWMLYKLWAEIEQHARLMEPTLEHLPAVQTSRRWAMEGLVDALEHLSEVTPMAQD